MRALSCRWQILRLGIATTDKRKKFISSREQVFAQAMNSSQTQKIANISVAKVNSLLYMNLLVKRLGYAFNTVQ